MDGLARVAGALAAISLLAGLVQPVGAVPLGQPPRQGATATPTWSSPLQVRLPGLEEPAPEPDQEPAPEPAREATPPDCAKLKCVALTLDDGPVAGTAKVLSLLRRKHAHATFFVMGTQARAHPGLIRRMVADGHAVGNHSWNHPEFWHLSGKGITRQLARTDAVVKRAAGTRPSLLRPPFGEVDRRVRKAAKARGQAIILWDVDPRDWKDRKAATVAKRVLRQTHRGSIILVHDVWPSTRHALPRIIDGLQARGFTLVTVPELLGGRQRPGHVYLRA